MHVCLFAGSPIVHNVNTSAEKKWRCGTEVACSADNQINISKFWVRIPLGNYCQDNTTAGQYFIIVGCLAWMANLLRRSVEVVACGVWVLKLNKELHKDCSMMHEC